MDFAVDGEELLLFAEALFAAARAAWVTGTWMPRDGNESDLRRVLYGMAADVRLIDAGCEGDGFGFLTMHLFLLCVACSNAMILADHGAGYEANSRKSGSDLGPWQGWPVDG